MMIGFDNVSWLEKRELIGWKRGRYKLKKNKGNKWIYL